MNCTVHPVKRGAHGPSPARKNRLWETSAARKGALVVTDAATGELLSSKLASQEQLARYAAMRSERLLAAGMERGAIRLKADGSGLDARSRRWLRRMSEGCHETMIHRATARCARMLDRAGGAL